MVDITFKVECSFSYSKYQRHKRRELPFRNASIEGDGKKIKLEGKSHFWRLKTRFVLYKMPVKGAQ